MPRRSGPGFSFAIAMAAAAAVFADPLGIRNSKHDFSMTGSGGKYGSQDTNQVCIFCHAPHHAMSTQLVWNRSLPNAAAFNVYGGPANPSPTFKATPQQPKSPSLRCLACHDGSVAVDAFNAGRTWTARMPAIGDINYPGSPYGAAGANIGGNYAGNDNVNDLTDDHPISFVFNDALATQDGQLQTPANVESAGLPLYGKDPANKTLECTTCHEVHRQYPFKWLLRVDVEDASALCRTCHLK